MLGIAYAKRSLQGATRGSESGNLPRLFCTRLLCLGLSRGPRPSDCLNGTLLPQSSAVPSGSLLWRAFPRLLPEAWFAGFIVHPCTRCSQGSPFRSTFGGYNSTFPRSRFTGLVDGTCRPASCAAPLGLRLSRTLPRTFPRAWLTALCSRKAVPPRWGYDCVVVFRACSHRLGSFFILHNSYFPFPSHPVLPFCRRLRKPCERPRAGMPRSPVWIIQWSMPTLSRIMVETSGTRPVCSGLETLR